MCAITLFRSANCFPVDQLLRYLGKLKFYRRFLPEIKILVLTLAAILVGKEQPKKQGIAFIPEASQAFAKSQQILADTVQLAHLYDRRASSTST